MGEPLRVVIKNSADMREFLHAERIFRGLHQSELATKAGLQQSCVSEVETGVRADPRISTHLKILAGLGWRMVLEPIGYDKDA